MKAPTNTLTMDRFDGCAEFDERLLESAFAPTLDAEVDTHLARCGRCRRARDTYLTTADALSVALSSGEARAHNAAPIDARSIAEPSGDSTGRPSTGAFVSASKSQSKPLPKRRWGVLLYALAAASVLVAAAWLAHLNAVRHTDFAIVSTADDARIEFTEPRHAVLRQGTAEFEVGSDEAIVDTPLGSVRAKDAKFRISTSLGMESTEMNRNEAALLVTVLVTSGAAWWSSKDEVNVRIGTGETLVRPETKPAETRSSWAGLESTEITPASASRVNGTVSSAVPAEKDIRAIGRVLDDATGLPLGDSDVHFRVLMDGAHLFEARGRSSADGAFAIPIAEVEVASTSPSISDLKPNVPDMIVAHAGFAPLHDNSPNLKNRVARWKSGTPLEPGTPLALGDVRMKHGTRLSGRVLDERGRGVADAELYLSSVGNGIFASSALTARAIGRTDDLGRMVIGDLLQPAAGDENFLLTALAERGLGWAMLVIVPGRDAIDDVVIHLTSQATLSVSVVDAEDHPIPGAKLKVLPFFPPHQDCWEDDERAAWPGANERLAAIFLSNTDAGGRARFEHLPLDERHKARYTLIAECEGFSRAEVRAIDFDRPSDATRKIVLPKKRLCAISGRMLDEQSRPIEGATVSAPKGQSAAADAQGSYRLAGFDPDDPYLSLTAHAPGLPDVPRNVRLSPKADLEGIDFVFAAYAPIEGRIVDEAGKPLAGAEIGISQPPRNEKPVITDKDGRFAFPTATSGQWSGWVYPPEPSDEWAVNEDVMVRGGDRSAVIVMKRIPSAFARLSAEIVDNETGELLDPLDAEVVPHTGSAVGRLWGSTRCERLHGRVVKDRVRAGDARLWVLVPGRAVAYADFSVREGVPEVFVQVKVGRPSTISGRVAFGELPVEAGVRLDGALMVPGTCFLDSEWKVGGLLSAQCALQPNGEFKLDNLVPGRWRLTLAGKRLLAAAEVEVLSGAEARVDLQARLGGTLVLSTTNALPMSLMELTVQRSDRAWDPGNRSVDVEEQRYETRMLVMPGTYHWTARFISKDGSLPRGSEVAEPQSGDVSVAAGETTNVPVPFVPK